MEHSETTILQSKPVLAERFELVATIGEGAAGTVYRVRDRANGGKEVALKILMNKAAFDENTILRFNDEIKVLKKLRHPNLVEAYEIIHIDSTVAFTMEYVEGADLARITHKRDLSYEEIDNILSQLLGALHELHLNGVIHRDVKMENVLVRPDGVVKLSDLGLMKQTDSKGLTRTGILLGTAQYMPPEYIRTSSYDARGDVYASGILLYEILTKRRWLSDKQGLEALQHLIKTNFVVPLDAVCSAPAKYLRILARALEAKPKKRYQTALEMREAIMEITPSCVALKRNAVTIRDFCGETENQSLFSKWFKSKK